MTYFSDADRALLAELGDLLDRGDPVPEHVTAAAVAAGELIDAHWDWEWLDRLADVRPVRASGARAHSFTGRASIDVEATGIAKVRLAGLVTSAERFSSVEVCWPAGSTSVAVDSCGRFDVADLPNGPVRLLLRRPGLPVATTGWFVP
ncbi:hypothetical protein EV193_101524 [Herbihabitans rhizosphaerae]|uniref:Uncharacterized protein n=1 Tax=Herbihabitans rhizosphaerae TaxID=1872711 RepID=A0A4Q7L4T5_9PSEU|nr:hypothetical protein [Herbihabitans rhizosphaerae]RZS44648.1 hypothetical protein EV193_101524 [Herbihabitans rhizosphaerae]